MDCSHATAGLAFRFRRKPLAWTAPASSSKSLSLCFRSVATERGAPGSVDGSSKGFTGSFGAGLGDSVARPSPSASCLDPSGADLGISVAGVFDDESGGVGWTAVLFAAEGGRGAGISPRPDFPDLGEPGPPVAGGDDRGTINAGSCAGGGAGTLSESSIRSSSHGSFVPGRASRFTA